MEVIRSFFKKHTKESLSIMIIPHTGEGIKQIKFKKLVFYTFFISIFSMSVFLGVLIYTLNGLNNELDAKIKHISRLQATNVQQAQEIHDLKDKAIIVNQKLSILNDLETKVRDLVGLKNTKVNNESSKPITRSFIRQDYRNLFNTSSMKLEGRYINDVEDNMELLAEEMDKEVENLNILIEEVTGQLKVLNAKPDYKPVDGRITSKFGYRKSPFTGKTQFHKGIDIANKRGTEVKAAGSGVVTFAGWNSGYGRTIIVSHGYGYRSVYAHNDKLLVEVGNKINKGETIAKLGSSGMSTGPHLHFEIHYNGKQINPLTILDD